MADHVLVLAAGRGTRMGGPKALMRVAGLPWWEVQQRRLDALGVAQTWLVSQAVRSGLAGQPGSPTRLVDADETEAMFATLVRGVRALAVDPPRGVFVLPIDVPVAREGVWEALAGSAGSVAVPVCAGRRGHPIYLLWSWVASAVLARADDPDARLDELVRHERVEVVVDDPACTMNLNTRADLQRWIAMDKGQQ